MRPSFSFALRSRYMFGILLAGLLLTQPATTAYADPHAVFYTAVGQQQLFFNILAALDQADYVEPAESTTGTPPGGSRKDLLNRREEAGFGPETDNKVAATKTDLAGILSRSVTLEGHDLWTAYLTHQFALEVARRTATDEVLRVYCERGLGRPGCTNKPADQKKDDAFIVDITKEINTPAVRADAALQSGTAADQATRQKIAAGARQAPQEPRPYDPFIAQARKNTQGDAAKSAAVERLATAASNVGSNVVDPNAYNGVQIDSDGTITSTAQTIDDFTNSLSRVASQPLAYLTTKMNYQTRAQIAQGITTDSGVKADTTIKAQGSKTTGITSIEEIVTAPVQARTALIDAGADIVGQEATNLAYAAPEGEHTPGTQELVNRPIAAGRALGIQTSATDSASSARPAEQAPEGQVAGILDNLSGLLSIFGFYDQPKQPLDPNVNPIAPIRESGSERFVDALTSDTYRSDDPKKATSGFGLGQNAARDFIFSFWNQLWCWLVPNSSSCQL